MITGLIIISVCIITVGMILPSRWRRAQAGSVDDYCSGCVEQVVLWQHRI